MRRLLMSVLMVRIPSFGNKVLSSNIIINCNITFPASDCLSQTNNAMEGGLIRSKRIIRTIYGRSRRSTRQIHEAQCTLTSTAQCPVRRWFAFQLGGLWICGSNLNWIAFMGHKPPPSQWRTYEFFSEANINAIRLQLLKLLWMWLNSN